MTIKNAWTILIAFLLTNCTNTSGRTQKTPILKADREAPLGWVYLTIYQDSTFEFTLTGIRADKDVYKGRVDIRNDSLFFAYLGSIPDAGNTAIFNDKVVAYIDGKYPEQLKISLTELTP